MKIENLATIFQRLEIAHLISSLFQNAQKASQVISSQIAQQPILESTQKPQEVEKSSETEDKKKSRKQSQGKNPHNLDILA